MATPMDRHDASPDDDRAVDVPLVGVEDRVVRRPSPSQPPAWVGVIDQDMAITRAGLPGDESIWVLPEVLDTPISSHVGGVPALITLDQAESFDGVVELQARMQADVERVYSHSFQIEGSQFVFGPPEGALLAPFLFRVAYMSAQEFDPDDVERLARDSALTAVTSHAYTWILELWRWAGVVGARQIPMKRQHYYRYLADLIRPNGDSFQVMPYPHRTTISSSQTIIPRYATPLTAQSFTEIVERVAAGTPAPAAPLLLMGSIDTADHGDLRTALVLAGTALDLILDEIWVAARAADSTLSDLGGTLGRRVRTFETNSIRLPLAMTASALQADVIDMRNAAAHGDELDDEDAWSALAVMVDIARERWPEGPPSSWAGPATT